MRPLIASAASSAITVVSPPSGFELVAITVSEPPSLQVARRGERLARAQRVQSVERVDQDDGVRAARRQPAGLVDDQLDGVVLRLGGGREASRRHRA